MKKILFSLIILVLITGCGVKNNEKNSSNEEIKTSKVEKVLKENRMQKFNISNSAHLLTHETRGWLV